MKMMMKIHIQTTLTQQPKKKLPFKQMTITKETSVYRSFSMKRRANANACKSKQVIVIMYVSFTEQTGRMSASCQLVMGLLQTQFTLIYTPLDSTSSGGGLHLGQPELSPSAISQTVYVYVYVCVSMLGNTHGKSSRCFTVIALHFCSVCHDLGSYGTYTKMEVITESKSVLYVLGIVREMTVAFPCQSSLMSTQNRPQTQFRIWESVIGQEQEEGIRHEPFYNL